MGAARDDEDPHQGHGHVPKLIMAGRLVGTLDGRPVVIDADDTGITLGLGSLGAAWSAWKGARSSRGLLGLLKRSNVAVRVTIARSVTLELLPRPSTVARIALPWLVEPT